MTVVYGISPFFKKCIMKLTSFTGENGRYLTFRAAKVGIFPFTYKYNQCKIRVLLHF